MLKPSPRPPALGRDLPRSARFSWAARPRPRTVPTPSKWLLRAARSASNRLQHRRERDVVRRRGRLCTRGPEFLCGGALHRAGKHVAQDGRLRTAAVPELVLQIYPSCATPERGWSSGSYPLGLPSGGARYCVAANDRARRRALLLPRCGSETIRRLSDETVRRSAPTARVPSILASPSSLSSASSSISLACVDGCNFGIDPSSSSAVAVTPYCEWVGGDYICSSSCRFWRTTNTFSGDKMK